MLPENHPLNEAQAFLMLLFEKAPPEQYVEFAAIWNEKSKGKPAPDGKKVHVDVAQVKDLEKVFDNVLADWITRENRGGRDIYFGVCPRRTVPRTKDGYPLRAKNENVSHAVCAWMDYDKSTYKAVAAEEPKATFVVFSGHGAHFYWIYPEAVDIQKATEDSLALSKKYGGDSTSDAARLLRVPGTRNWKDIDKEVRAEVAADYTNPDAVFVGYKAPDVEVKPGEVVKVKRSIAELPWDLRTVIMSGYSAAEGSFSGRDPQTGEVDRSKVDFRVMCSLMEFGYTEDDIKDVFFNKDYGISEKILVEESAKGNAEHYFHKTYDKARLEYQKKSLLHEEIGDTVDFETWADIRKAPQLEFAIDRILPVGGMLIVSGPAKSGKSLLVNDMALLLSGVGGKFMDRFEIKKTGTVVYCQAELSKGSLDWRLSMIANSRDADWRKVPIMFLNRSFDVSSPKHVYAIANGLKKIKADYFIIDPLARFHHGDENKQRDMSSVLSNIERISRETGVLGTIVVHHFGKPPSDGGAREGVHQIRGASVIGDWGNAHILLSKRFNKITGKKFVEVSFELRDAEEPDPIRLSLNRQNMRFMEYSEDNERLNLLKRINEEKGTDDEKITAIQTRLKVSKEVARQLFTQEKFKPDSGNGGPKPQVGGDTEGEDEE